MTSEKKQIDEDSSLGFNPPPPPPPYDDDLVRGAVSSNQGHPVRNLSEPLVLECHERGLSGRDKVLTEDGETIMFYYKHDHKLTGWDSELREGGPEGTLVCRGRKHGFSSSFDISLPDGRQADCVRTNKLSVATEFSSPLSGTRFKWKNVGFPGQGSKLELVDLSGSDSSSKIAASWEARSKLLNSQNGTLTIVRDYLDELEVICATALMMYAIEYSRQGGLV